jgi:hypothetical protein
MCPVGAVYDRPFFGGIRQKTGGHRPPLQESTNQSPSDHAIEAGAKIERTAYEARSRLDHFADTITRFAGSGTAILIHLIWFFLWLIAFDQLTCHSISNDRCETISCT